MEIRLLAMPVTIRSTSRCTATAAPATCCTTRTNWVWTNETVHAGSNYGKDLAIALNAGDEVVIVPP